MTVDPGTLAEIARFADELPAAIWVGVVPSGECVYVNREFEDILGFAPPPEATRGEYASSYGVFTRDGRAYPEDQMPYERAIRARKTVVIDDLVVRRGPRPYTYLRVFAKPLFDDGGNITHIVEAFVDITREVDAENARAESDTQLRHAQKMESLGNLAGGIAHDFNNMLGALKLLGSQLAMMQLDPTAATIVNQMNDVTESAARLTRALLGFAQRTRSVQRPLDVNRVVDSIATIVRRTIDRRIELHTDLTDAATDVVADESQLEQVLFNLVLNARDAIEASGAITVRTRAQTLDEPTTCGSDVLPPGKYVVFEVVDTGTGISTEIRDRVFEPYFTTKTAGANRGTGLGLATAYGAVKRNGGGITIAETSPRGTTFRVYLPASDVPSERDSGSQIETPRDDARGEGLLLLADDDPIVREASAVALRRLGYEVKTAADGSEALALFRRHHCQLAGVVLDLVMPVMSGREALVAMQTIDASVPVIIATGSLLDEHQRASLGSVAVLAKPYGPRELTRAVAREVSARTRERAS